MSLSALENLHLLERSYAFEAVKPPVADSDYVRWVGTSLSIAGVPLLVGEGEIQEIIETPPVTTIPGTKPWVMGVASFKGGLLPIVSGDVLFRKRPYSGRVRDYCMVINRPTMYCGITLSGIQRDLKFPIEERDMNHPVDPDFAPFCLGGFKHDDNFLAVLDIDKLAADDDMCDASASQIFLIRGQTDD
jgi:twitching motility protein PilI